VSFPHEKGQEVSAPLSTRPVKNRVMTTSPSRSHAPTSSRSDDVSRIVALLQREARPLAPASIWHTCGIGNGVLALMLENGELERTDRGLLRLARRKVKQ
jgi:hypothetical protein